VFVRLLGKTLEQEFQAELDIAVIRDGIGNVSEGTGSRETGAHPTWDATLPAKR